MFNIYVEKFMPSRVMLDYLKNQELDHYEITDLIASSPMSLKDKLDAFIKLKNETQDNDLKNCCDDYISYIENAYELLVKEGVFSLEIYYLDEAGTQNSWFEKVIASYADLKNVIQEEIEICEIGSHSYYWFEVWI